MDGWVTQLRKGLLEFCILNLLRRGESYGYEIVRKLQPAEVLAVSESTVYPILSRLKQDGCLKVRDLPSPGGPPRRYFALTASGRARLAEMNAYWGELTAELDRLRKGEK
ncbi:MAG: PadR family transcriptional regulator [Lentisphaeria bacterium]|jgi:PadR family transcriptional regulator PadR